VTRRKTQSEPSKTSRPPATTPEDREQQLISAAVNLAEKQIREGTASSQVITHYLKMGSHREKYEREKIRLSSELDRVKVEAIAAQQRVEELYKNALDAMRSYSGQDGPSADDHD